MGFAIVVAAARRGAMSRWSPGPVSVTDAAFCKRVDVITALDMEAAVQAAVRALIFSLAAPPWLTIAQRAHRQ